MNNSRTLDKVLTRQYSNFMGVDFRGGEVPYYHSPDALNMWRDYLDNDCIQTRPGMTLLHKFSESIFGLFFYNVNNQIQVLVHSGTKLYKWDNYPNSPAETTELATELNPKQSRSFIFNGTFYFVDGIDYYKYDGKTFSRVEGTTPTTSYFMNPDGSTDIDSSVDTDYIYQNVNCLTPNRRNRFITDGESTIYRLNSKNIDDQPVKVESYNTLTGETKYYVQGVDYSVNTTEGTVTFTTAPEKDLYIYVLFKRTVSYLRERIMKCTITGEFDNRVFFTGNPDYPQAIFWTAENDPEYFEEDARLECGVDLAPIKSLIPGNNVLWVIKETSQNYASVYYLTPTINSVYGKYYSPVGGNISVGCASTGINFNDDIVFFSNKGLESISSTSMYSEQLLTHRSSFVDAKLLKEENYTELKLAEYNGYLFVFIDNHVYLADTRKKITLNTGTEYEWFYWEMPINIDYVTEYRGALYFGDNEGRICILRGTKDNIEEEMNVHSYITTRKDDFGYPSYTKTTSKKGAEINLDKKGNSNITITSITDDVEKKTQVISDEKGYAVFKMKNKKFFKLQYKISSDEPFGIYSMVIQGFVAGYLKR